MLLKDDYSLNGRKKSFSFVGIEAKRECLLDNIKKFASKINVEVHF